MKDEPIHRESKLNRNQSEIKNDNKASNQEVSHNSHYQFINNSEERTLMDFEEANQDGEENQ